MRIYHKAIHALVTLVFVAGLAGCASLENGASPNRTPSGGAIENLPDFSVANTPNGAKVPLATDGRAQSSPYYAESGKTPPDPANFAPVKVALLVPLSGAQANLGQAMMNAAQMALFDMNTPNVTIVPRDTNLGAAKAAREAINDGAGMILGPLFANDVKAVSPIAAAAHVPVVAFSTDWTAATDNTYIMGFLPFGQVTRVVDFAQKRGATNIAALIPQTAYGTAIKVTLQNTAAHNGLPTPQAVIFANDKIVPATQKIAALHSDAIMLPLGGVQLAQAAVQLRQNDVAIGRTRILGTGLWDDSPQAGMQVPGGWYAAPDPTARLKFNQRYTETYGTNPPRLTTLAYDATALAAALARKGQYNNGTPAFDRVSLTDLSGFSGLDGIFRFRSDGLVERGLAVLELDGSGARIIDPAPTRF